MPLARDTKILIGWACCTVTAITLFALSKKSIEKRRYESMKIRQRMLTANQGEYEPSYRKFSTSFK